MQVLLLRYILWISIIGRYRRAIQDITSNFCLVGGGRKRAGCRFTVSCMGSNILVREGGPHINDITCITNHFIRLAIGDVATSYSQLLPILLTLFQDIDDEFKKKNDAHGRHCHQLEARFSLDYASLTTCLRQQGHVRPRPPPPPHAEETPTPCAINHHYHQ